MKYYPETDTFEIHNVKDKCYEIFDVGDCYLFEVFEESPDDYPENFVEKAKEGDPDSLMALLKEIRETQYELNAVYRLTKYGDKWAIEMTGDSYNDGNSVTIYLHPESIARALEALK